MKTNLLLVIFCGFCFSIGFTTLGVTKAFGVLICAENECACCADPLTMKICQCLPKSGDPPQCDCSGEDEPPPCSPSCSNYCGTKSDGCGGTCGCRECGPIFTYGVCDPVTHKRSVSCSENCGTNDCAGTPTIEDCIGTVNGTLFDASDCLEAGGCACMAAAPKVVNNTFAINGNWPVLSQPMTNSTGKYSVTAYSPSTYSFDFASLRNDGYVTAPRFVCTGSTYTLTTGNEIFTRNFGFWRVYGGWWQVVGGNVHANQIKSVIPAFLPANQQYLIRPATTGRSGFVSAATGIIDLGLATTVRVSETGVKAQSEYGGDRTDYEYFLAKTNQLPKTNITGETKPEFVPAEDADYMIVRLAGGGDIGGWTLNGATQEKIMVLADGDVNITGDILVPQGAFLTIIAKGSINILPNVVNIQGWYIADYINVPCKDLDGNGCDKTDNQLLAEGSFIGWRGISLLRDRDIANNTAPTELFTYRQDFWINAPDAMEIRYRNFKEYLP